MSATRTPRVVVPEKREGRPSCGALSKGGVGAYRCVRPLGHRGRHATYWLTDLVGLPGEVLAVWP